MSVKRTIFICKALCWYCKKEFKAAYGKWERNEKQCVVSPGNFSEKEKAVAAENRVIIKTVVYPNDDVYTVNICPHCNKPYGNNYIEELVGHEEIEIVTLNQDSTVKLAKTMNTSANTAKANLRSLRSTL